MSEIRTYLEIIYFLTGPVLFVVACMALSQIKIAKGQLEEQRNTTKIMAKRDALRITSEQIKEYGVKIIPILDLLDRKIKSEDIRFFKDSKVVIDKETIKVTPCGDDAERQKLTKITNEFTAAANSLEGFSSYFFSGVADECMAYRSLSSTFCGSVSRVLKKPAALSTGRRE